VQEEKKLGELNRTGNSSILSSNRTERRQSQKAASKKSTLASIINARGVEGSRGLWMWGGTSKSWPAFHALLNFLNETDRLRQNQQQIRKKSGR